MGDDARRAAERRWRESGEAGDGRRYLAHLERGGRDEVEALRVRLAIGDLHRERALLAAHVGHGPARAVLSWPAAPEADATTLDVWGEALFGFGQAACVRAALAASGVVVASAPTVEGGDPEADPRRALAAAEAWLACPCPRHYRECERWNVMKGRVAEWAWQTVTATHCPPLFCSQRVWHHTQAIREAMEVVGAEPVRVAMRQALVPWALPARGADQPLERPAL